jgi:phage shock protein C
MNTQQEALIKFNFLFMKKLHKSDHSRIASGILGGLGEWMEVNPQILRVGYVILAIITGIIPAVLLYSALHFVIPRVPRRYF